MAPRVGLVVGFHDSMVHTSRLAGLPRTAGRSKDGVGDLWACAH